MKSCFHFILFGTFAATLGFSNLVAAQEAPLFAILLGANEISADGQANAGDLTGRGGVTIIPRGSDNSLCFGIVVTGIDIPTALHIHLGVAGQNGAPVVGLNPLPFDGNPGESSGCIADVDPAILALIRDKQLRFYVNIHTLNFPDGALRGQLF
jgi:CHRD domain